MQNTESEISYVEHMYISIANGFFETSTSSNYNINEYHVSAGTYRLTFDGATAREHKKGFYPAPYSESILGQSLTEFGTIATGVETFEFTVTSDTYFYIMRRYNSDILKLERV